MESSASTMSESPAVQYSTVWSTLCFIPCLRKFGLVGVYLEEHLSYTSEGWTHSCSAPTARSPLGRHNISSLATFISSSSSSIDISMPRSGRRSSSAQGSSVTPSTPTHLLIVSPFLSQMLIFQLELSHHSRFAHLMDH